MRLLKSCKPLRLDSRTDMSATSSKDKSRSMSESSGRSASGRRRVQKVRRLNVPLLAGSFAVVFVLSLLGFFWHRHQTAKMHAVLKDRAGVLEGDEKWAQAADYWQRYLWLKPDDFSARMKLVEARERLAATPTQRYYLSLLLHDTQGRLPEGDDENEVKLDLNIRIAKNFLEMGDYAGAYAKAFDLLDLDSREPQPPAGQAGADLRRILAISGAVLARPGVIVEDAMARASADQRMLDVRYAANDLAVALAESPGDVKLAEIGANFYRVRAEQIPGGVEAAVMRADRLIDKLVEAQPNDPDALATRFAYRSRYPAGNAKPPVGDLDAALEVNPNHYIALIYKANSIASTEPDAARELLTKAIKQEAKDVRAYLLLAHLEIDQENLDEALTTLRDARTAVGTDNSLVGDLFTRLLIRTGKLSEARTALEELEAVAQVQNAELSVAARRQMQDRLRVLRGQLEVASGNLNLAADALRTVVAPSGQADAGPDSRESQDAKRIMAHLMEQKGYWDLAATYWQGLSALPQQPSQSQGGADASSYRTAVAGAVEAMRRAAAALLATGQYDAAIQQIDRYLHPPASPGSAAAWEPKPDAWLLLTQAHLQKQLAVRPESRNWSEFDAALVTARRLNPNRWELSIAEFERQLARESSGSLEQARAVLALAETTYKDNADFWRSAALCYTRLGMPAEAERVIVRYEELEPNEARQALLRAMVASRSSDFAAAEQALKKAIELAEPQVKLGLQCMEVELLLASGENERAFAASKGLVESNPKERRVLQVALESALRMKEYKVAEAWEGKFRAADPTDKFTAGVFEARRLLDQYDKSSAGERTHLAQLVGSLRDQRPDWGDIIALSARISDLQGNRSQALADYQRAVARGVKNPTVIERLVTLLYADGRAEEADGYFARLASSRASSPAIDSLKIAVAVQRNDLAEAIELAEKGVDNNPDDPVQRIWLARLLVENKENEVAERTLRDAQAAFPEDARVWSALFLLLHRAEKADEAGELLEKFISQPTAVSWERHLIAAQAFQMQGDRERALAEAQAAVNAKGENIPSRMLLGKLLTAVDVDRAADEFRKVIEIDKTHGEARRHLSILLAMSGDESQLREAMVHLQNDDAAGMTADGLADNRVRAALLSYQGRDRKQRLENLMSARKIMLEQIETRGAAAPDLDRMFLAKLYEQESSLRGDVTLLQAAREQLQQLSSRADAPVANLREYAEFLLRQLGKTQVPAGQEEAWSTLRSSIRDDATQLAEECGSRLDAHTIDPERPASVVEALHLTSARARLLSKVGNREAAKETLAKFETDALPEFEKQLGQPRSWIPLASLYAAIDDHARAEEWFRKLVDVAPETYPLLVRELANQDRVADAVEVCLAEATKSSGSSPDAAIVLAQVLAGAPEEAASMERGAPTIAAALAAHPENLDLLLAVAVLRVAHNDDAEAIRLFEQVVKLSPKNPLALNNLATLLAERPERREAALGFVKRAMDESGRQPPFLDTLGTIQMRSGQTAQAIASLEEAVANGGGDPRYYFHLAAAYQLGRQPDEARAALREAMQRGLDEQILTQGDQQLLLDLKKQLAPAATPQLESQTTQPDDELQSAAPRARRFAA